MSLTNREYIAGHILANLVAGKADDLGNAAARENAAQLAVDLTDTLFEVLYPQKKPAEPENDSVGEVGTQTSDEG